MSLVLTSALGEAINSFHLAFFPEDPLAEGLPEKRFPQKRDEETSAAGGNAGFPNRSRGGPLRRPRIATGWRNKPNSVVIPPLYPAQLLESRGQKERDNLSRTDSGTGTGTTGRATNAASRTSATAQRAPSPSLRRSGGRDGTGRSSPRGRGQPPPASLAAPEAGAEGGSGGGSGLAGRRVIPARPPPHGGRGPSPAAR